ncbi:putative E3 ubiquitin-protein ligase MYCBP2 [Cricetulus griseus]|nr:putative E3 ubiquitin-protein ligase MYCBP2 [Cricetulus griseus]
MPEKLWRLWQDSSVLILVQKLTERILRRTHWMTGLIIAVVMGIIALTSTAATPGLALHKEIAEFVRDRHRHSAELWAQQNKIASEIVNEIADLKQAVLPSRERDFGRIN